MSDEFLHQQRTPRRSFADALGKRLQAIEQEDAVVASNGHARHLQPEDTKSGEQRRRLKPSQLRRYDMADVERVRQSPAPLQPSPRPSSRSPLRVVGLVAACLGVVAALAVGFSPRPQEAASLVQIENALLPTDLQRITVENIDRLEVVATLGEGVLNTAGWSPDGATIAAGGARGVWLMDARNPQQRELLPSGDVGILTVAYSPDGATLAAGGYAGEVILYNAASRARTAAFPAPPGGFDIHQLLWIDEARLAVVLVRTGMTRQGMNFQFYLWELAITSGEWNPLEENTLLIGGRAALSPDGRWLAYPRGDQDGAQLALLDLRSRDREFLATYTNGVQALTFSRDGETLYAAHEFGIDRWDMATGEELPRIDRERRFVQIRTLAAAPDGRVLVVVDAGEGYATYTLADDALTPLSDVQSYTSFPLQAAFSPTGDQYLIPETNGLRFGSLDNPELRQVITYNNGVAALALDDAGQTLAALEWGEGQPPRLWDLATGEDRQLVFERPTNDHYATNSIVDLSGDGSRLLTGTTFATLIDTTTAEVLWRNGPTSLAGAGFTGRAAAQAGSAVLFDALQDEVFRYDLALGASFNPLQVQEQVQAGAVGGDTVALGIYNGLERTGGVVIYDAPRLGEAGAEAEAVLTLGDRDIDALAFSRDGRWLAIATSDLGERGPQVVDLMLWNWETGRTLGTHQNAALALSALAVSEDGRLVYALANLEGVLRVWDMERSQAAATLDGEANGWALTELALSADERLLITGGYDGLIRVWGVRG